MYCIYVADGVQGLLLRTTKALPDDDEVNECVGMIPVPFSIVLRLGGIIITVVQQLQTVGYKQGMCAQCLPPPCNGGVKWFSAFFFDFNCVGSQ
eukprot:scaffold421898_cov18-Prasinocladus_malaysianus.AAC.1